MHLASWAGFAAVPAAVTATVAHKGRVAAEQNIEDDAQAPEVTALVVDAGLLAEGLHHFGGHVLRRAALWNGRGEGRQAGELGRRGRGKPKGRCAPAAGTSRGHVTRGNAQSPEPEPLCLTVLLSQPQTTDEGRPHPHLTVAPPQPSPPPNQQVLGASPSLPDRNSAP